MASLTRENVETAIAGYTDPYLEQDLLAAKCVKDIRIDDGAVAVDIARTLGCNQWAAFYRVVLPAARPAIIAGLSLALMETLADFGTVQHFGVAVFTTGIFRTWFGLGDAAAAAQLAAVLLGFVFTVTIVFLYRINITFTFGFHPFRKTFPLSNYIYKKVIL